MRDLEIISEELRKKVEYHENTKIIFSVHSTRGLLLLVRYGDHIIFTINTIPFFLKDEEYLKDKVVSIIVLSLAVYLTVHDNLNLLV